MAYKKSNPKSNSYNSTFLQFVQEEVNGHSHRDRPLSGLPLTTSEDNMSSRSGYHNELNISQQQSNAPKYSNPLNFVSKSSEFQTKSVASNNNLQSQKLKTKFYYKSKKESNQKPLSKTDRSQSNETMLFPQRNMDFLPKSNQVKFKTKSQTTLLDVERDDLLLSSDGLIDRKFFKSETLTSTEDLLEDHDFCQQNQTVLPFFNYNSSRRTSLDNYASIPKVQYIQELEQLPSILFTTCRVSSNIIEKFIKNLLPDYKFNIDVLSENQFDKTKVVLRFENLSKAKTALRVLQELDDNSFTAELGIENSSKDVHQTFDLLYSRFIKKAEIIFDQCDKNLSKIHSEIENKTENITFQDFASKQQYLIDRRIELANQKQEFQTFMDEMKLKQESIKTDSPDLILKQTKELFSQELLKLKEPLPIYTQRQIILDAIKKISVCILIGGIGSGTSTELVQYIYHKEICNNGLIVCTQPRSVSAVCFANEVSQKMDQEVGQLVGYQTGMHNKLSLKTKILYMTDEIMINECLRDPKLNIYSCIIVDQVTERNLSTDLLLSVLKSCLKKRNDLKIIILVSNNDTQLLEKYFKCSVIQIPEKDFPIKVQYQIENEQKYCYIDKTIELICKILNNSDSEENILIYLATLSEVEEACFKLRNVITANDKKTCVILRLYDRLPLNELTQLFNTNRSKRKIIFSVKCAELLQILPNIYHVIDTGMEKKIVYDSVSNSNTVQIKLTNKISTELRTFRSGIESIKKCYLIYTKEQHDEMENSLQPQCTLLNPELLITKLFLLQTDFPDLQFVNPFEAHDLLLITTKRLQEIDVISEKGQLSPLGKKIAHLFIEPLLSKMIFLGIEKGIGIEAISLAAIMTISGEELLQWDFKQEDCSVYSFLGDPWTLFQMYKNWKFSLDSKKNTLNNRFLTLIDNLVLELFTYINNHLKINVLLGWQNNTEIKEVLRKIFFECYWHNLCVHSGNNRLGYVHCQSGKIMHLPTKSVFMCLNQQSNFVIYDKFIKSSRKYMLNATTVKQKWFDNPDLKCKIDKTLIQSRIEEVGKFTLSGISKYIMKQAFNDGKNSKLSEVEMSIATKCNCDVVIVDPNLKKGILDIFIPSEYHLKAKQAIDEIIEKEKESLELMDEESFYPNKTSNLRIVFDLGATVSNILQTFECREIVVRKINAKLKTMNIIKFMRQFGKIQGYKKEILDNKQTIKITFKNPQDAVKSLNSPGHNKLCNWKLSNNMIQPVKCHIPYSVIIVWNRKDLIASVKFPMNTFDRIVQSFVPSVKILEEYVTSSISMKDNRPTLDLSNLPSRISIKDIKNAFYPQPIEIIFSENKVYETSKADKLAIEEVIKLMIKKYQLKQILFNVSLKQPQKMDNQYLAFVNFENTSEGIITALNIIKGKETIAGKRLIVKPQFKDSLAIPMDLYIHLKQYFEYLIKKLIKFKNGFMNITIEEINSKEKLNEYVLLKFLTDNILDTMRIKLVFKNELMGDVMDCNQSIQSLYLLSKHGLKFLRKLQEKLCVYFNISHQVKTISMHGSSLSKSECKKEISKFLFQEILCHDIDIKSIPIRGAGIHKGFLKELFRKFGSYLENLSDMQGIINIKPNPNCNYIEVTGSKESTTLVEKLVTGFHINLKEPKGLSLENFQCEMCLSNSSKNIYQLASCGHEYCFECIHFYLYLKQIPFKCINSSCNSKFTIFDLNLLLTSNELKQLQEIAVRKYVEENSAKIAYCPTLNCNWIYFITDENNLIKCNECEINICSFCQDYSHSGITCSNYQLERKAQQKELDGNIDLSFSRFCPTCKHIVYKVDYCESVLCRSCETLFCWWCKYIFNSEVEAEAHENMCAVILLARFGNV